MGGGADWKRIGAGVMTGGASEGLRNMRGNGWVQDAAGGLTGGGKNGGPSTPDFTGAANEQARLSRNDVNGAFGGASWSQGPDGRWSLNMSMNPELQSAAGNLMGQIQNTPDAGAARDSAIDAAYRMQTSRLDPRFAQRRASLENQLANEGFSRGDEGFRTASADFGRQENDAYQQALLGAQSGAGNTAYAQTLAAAMMPYQQLQAIRGLGEGAGMASLNGAQAPDLMSALSAQYGGDLQKYGTQQAQKNSKNSGASNLAMLAML